MALEYSKKNNYLALIKNSIGTSLFKDLYFINNSLEDFEGIPSGSLANVAKEGQLSCPFYVSAILHLIGGVIDAPHATIDGTIRAMQARGWHQVRLNDGLYPGDVVVWETKEDDGNGHYKEGHGHIGFIIDEHNAASTSSRTQSIIMHHPEFRNMGDDIKPRKIVTIYAHPELSDRPELNERRTPSAHTEFPLQDHRSGAVA
jgi:hypothetical protein